MRRTYGAFLGSLLSGFASPLYPKRCAGICIYTHLSPYLLISCEYIYIHTHTYTYTSTCRNIYIIEYIYTYVCIYISLSLSLSLSLAAYMHVYKRMLSQECGAFGPFHSELLPHPRDSQVCAFVSDRSAPRLLESWGL